MEEMKITNTTTEYLKYPMGIDTNSPVFSWKMNSNVIGRKQVSYQIDLYKDSDMTNAIWSKSEQSDLSVGISYDGYALEPSTLYCWQVAVYDNAGNTNTSDYSYFETGVTGVQEWESVPFIQLTESYQAPIFRTEKDLQGNVVSARLYITAMGIYEAYINGEQVGVVNQDDTVTYHHMNPGYGNIDYNLYYETYNITSYLKDKEKFAVTILGGTGWYHGMGNDRSQPAVKAYITVTYEDGSTDTVATNSADWKGTLDGAITYNSIYHGETYNANNAVALGNYMLPDYDDINWLDVTETTARVPVIAQRGESGQLLDEYAREPISVTLYTDMLEYPESRYEGGEIIVETYIAYTYNEDDMYHQGETQIIDPEMSLFDEGVTLKAGQTMVINIGQNMAAIPQYVFEAIQGTEITIRYAEMLNDGSKVYTGTYSGDEALANEGQESALYAGDGPKGSVYLKSLRTARATSKYIFSGEGMETYRPQLTFFGYQYISLTATNDVTIHSMRSITISSVSKRSSMITTNNENVNQFVSNTMWSQLSNYFTIPTDCPQRDEREAWTGDAQVFAQTAVYNFDSMSFLRGFQEILSEITMNQGFPGSITSMNGLFTPLWGGGWSDVQIILPWTLYSQSGDKSILEENWEPMTRYMDYLEDTEREPHASLAIGSNGDFQAAFGDWLAFQGTGVELIADCYYGYVTQLMEQMAIALNKQEDVARYSEKFENIKQTFISNHIDIDDDGQITVRSDNGSASFDGKGGVMEPNSQTSLLWILKLGFYTDNDMKQQAINLLVENVKNENPDNSSIRAEYPENTLSVGFLGSNIITPVLTEIGYSGVAYDLLLQDQVPSWLGTVMNGATTIWERWNSYTKEDGFGHQEMNSFNHYSYGSVLEWMYEYMVGIASDSENPGFKNTILQPTPDTGTAYNSQDRIRSVSGFYESYYGNIAVDYQTEQGQFASYSVIIPANTTASLYLPVDSIGELETVYGASYIGMTERNGLTTAEFELLSGGYNFTVTTDGITVAYADGYVAYDEK